MTLPNAINQRWSLDFVSDALSDGRRFRILCIVDDFSRECLATVVDTSLGGVRVVRELEQLGFERSSIPRVIVSDNGTELTSCAVLRWATGRLDWHYIEPGKPVQNAFIESFNSRLLVTTLAFLMNDCHRVFGLPQACARSMMRLFGSLPSASGIVDPPKC